MGWGFFKKVVIADRLADYVNAAYANPSNVESAALVISTVFFAFQIYCDFSGYSDIALGTAKIMGFNLMTNFNSPYASQTISEFWKRWHISLSTWFKDYLYIPLGGSRVKQSRLYFNLVLTFLISGLWHGANWTYIVWGALNGCYLFGTLAFAGFWQGLAEWTRLTRTPKLLHTARVGLTFSLICVAWVFFRARTLSDAWLIVRKLFLGIYEIAWHTLAGLFQFSNQTKFDEFCKYLAEVKLGFPLSFFAISLALISLMEVIQWSLRNPSKRPQWIESRPGLWATAFLLVYGILGLGSFGSNQQFIYFQF
jgi:D-alanyl-lipoteichoic acid acyltransferase DltB (MBOAT superfamily)